MCEYCEKSSENKPILYEAETCTVIDVCSAGLAILACDDYFWITEINYCPMCGNKLFKVTE